MRSPPAGPSAAGSCPIASLVIPGLLVQQLWKGADGTIPRGDPGWRQAPAHLQIWCWWVAYVAAQALTFVGFTMAGQSDDPQGDITVADLLGRIDDVHLGVNLFVAGQLLMIVAAALAAATVVGLTRRQAETASAPPRRPDPDAGRLGRGGPPAVPSGVAPRSDRPLRPALLGRSAVDRPRQPGRSRPTRLTLWLSPGGAGPGSR